MTVEDFKNLSLPKKRQALREIAEKIDTAEALKEAAGARLSFLRNEIEAAQKILHSACDEKAAAAEKLKQFTAVI